VKLVVGICDWFSSDYPKWDWIAGAFTSLGHEVVKIRTTEGLVNRQSGCDFVLFSQRPPIDLEVVNEIKTNVPWVIWVFDYLGPQLPLMDLIPWKVFDLIFCKTPDAIKQFGYKTIQFDQACPPWPEPAGPPQGRPYELLFPGIYSPRRADIVRHWATRGFRIAVAGPGWPVSDTPFVHVGHAKTDQDMQTLFASATVTLGDNYDNNCYRYWSDRRWLALAAGSIYVGPHVTGSQRMLTDGNLDFANTPTKCRDSKWITTQWKWQNGIRANNTYAVRVKQLIDMLGERNLLSERVIDNGYVFAR
jgi:hypothetical protein